jgi:hypothetical protein
MQCVNFWPFHAKLNLCNAIVEILIICQNNVYYVVHYT